VFLHPTSLGSALVARGSAKLRVGVLGATGAAGLEFVQALEGHPWFEAVALYASSRSAGKPFAEACTLDVAGLSSRVREMTVQDLQEVSDSLDLVCSALPSELAKEYEARCAAHTPVVSTASAYRSEPEVPVMVLEANADHLRLLARQQRRGWKGWIAPGPNCTATGLVMSLCPLHRAVGLRRVVMSSYQSVSGGGYGLIQQWKEQRQLALPHPLEVEEPVADPPLMFEGNVIGHIQGEIEKVKAETKEILGLCSGDRVTPAGFALDCQCVRVPTVSGHFETVFVETERPCSPEEARALYAAFNAECREEYGDLPSSPKQTIVLLDRPPQPYFDANLQGGMATTIGMLAASEAFPGGLQYQVLSNNTMKGAAKGMIQVAEYLYREAVLRRKG
jgi:aspartate-semialdehyde dehydrogenase